MQSVMRIVHFGPKKRNIMSSLGRVFLVLMSNAWFANNKNREIML
jgi:hypothetical protein